MRKMFDHFPEVSLIDATHHTNNCHYKLFSFMVHDALGKGQHVQHALIRDEKAETLHVGTVTTDEQQSKHHEERSFETTRANDNEINETIETNDSDFENVEFRIAK
ncbi:hypothetical protein ATCC90586_003076 [Pythium insidiosum]|nr:hypothetical protein ATCC90586_003076 [Pythium insidiosum]